MKKKCQTMRFLLSLENVFYKNKHSQEKIIRRFKSMGKFKGLSFGIAAVAVASLFGCGEDSSTSSAGTSFEINDGSVAVIESSSSQASLVSSAAGILPNSSMSQNQVFPQSSSNAFVPSDDRNLQGSSDSRIPQNSGDSKNPNDSRDPENHEDQRFSSNSQDPHNSSDSQRPTNSSDSRNPVNPDNPEDHKSSAFEPPRSSSSVEPPRPSYAKILGADISQFQEYESYGTRIFDTDGTEKDIFTLLRDHGFNAIRLKTFLSPKAQYGYASSGCGHDTEAFGDKEHVVTYAQKVKKNGFTFLLDIHYSDVWADPDTQIIPERWRGVQTSDAMADSVYAYTYDLLAALKNVDALPDMVQVGNEITNGMLRDLPTSETNCWGDNVQLASNSVNGVMNKQQNPNGIANTVKYLSAGSRAVKAISSSIKTVFHIESPQNATTVEWWMSSIIGGNVSPDVMAFSAYTAYEHGNPSTWKTLLTNLSSKYPKLQFLIAEYNGGTGKNSYGYDGSRAQTHKIMEEVPNGLGAFFWEPAAYGEWGSALFDWDENNLKANSKAFDEYKVLF